jgi:hypothetical protein
MSARRGEVVYLAGLLAVGPEAMATEFLGNRHAISGVDPFLLAHATRAFISSPYRRSRDENSTRRRRDHPGCAIGRLRDSLGRHVTPVCIPGSAARSREPGCTSSRVDCLQEQFGT